MHGMKILCALCAAVLIFALFNTFGVPADAASSGEIREQINQMEEQSAKLDEKMQQLEEQLSENLSDIRETVKQKSAIDQQIVILQSQIKLTDERIAAFNVLIADKQDEVDEARLAFDALHNTYKERIRAMEEAGELSYWSVLFQANSFSELLDRMNLIDEIAQSDNRRLKELDAAAKEVARLQQELVEGKEELVAAALAQEASRQLLDEKRLAADELLQKLLSQGKEYELLLQQSEERQEQLMQEIAKMEIAYDAAAYSEWLATYVPPTTTAPPTTKPPVTPKPTEKPDNTDPSQPTEPTESDSPPKNAAWVTPVPYYVLTSPFGMRFHPILDIWRMHNGVDLACAEGTQIYASRGGVVTVASYQEDGAGNYVQIDHGDGYKSIYMHMTHYIVSPGEYVAAGQCIGYVGSTGLSDGNHLHFGISYNGTYVNPMEYIS